jgi:hypothetical protein
MPDLPPHHELSITIARICVVRMRIKMLAKTLWRGQVREPSELTMFLQTDLCVLPSSLPFPYPFSHTSVDGGGHTGQDLDDLMDLCGDDGAHASPRRRRLPLGGNASPFMPSGPRPADPRKDVVMVDACLGIFAVKKGVGDRGVIGNPVSSSPLFAIPVSSTCCTPRKARR